MMENYGEILATAVFGAMILFVFRMLWNGVAGGGI